VAVLLERSLVSVTVHCVAAIKTVRRTGELSAISPGRSIPRGERHWKSFSVLTNRWELMVRKSEI
jgi:hypothetical protein